ncbi:hypothetical protein DMA11_10330 [Marinilabiliaceae bacterium JC017]|nr:hypothetical protein DMA11_10330 [Marinilabiliaceae bacterium JC017]
MDFFNDIDDFRKYIQIPASVQVVALASPFRPAMRKVQNIIGKATYLQLKNHFDTPPAEPDPVLDEAVDYIQAALANLTNIDYFKLQAAERNASEGKLYKYQEDQAIDINIRNVWTEMDNLLELMENDTTKFASFAESDAYKERENLIFKNARDFDKYFGIDQSAYFFMRATYLQKEVIVDVLQKRGVEVATVDQDPKYEYAVKKALAYEVMAQASRRFEYPELPASIRQDLSDEMRRRVYKSSQETFIKETLFQELHNKAMTYMLDVEAYIQKSKSGAYSAPEEVNSEDNKFFFTT